MAEITEQDRTLLLGLARSAIARKLGLAGVVQRPEELSAGLKECRGCFVTLHKRGNLRGCIGTIEPIRPLVDGIEENALNSAFRDPRFPPVTAAELPQVVIEISVLTVPRPLRFTSPDDLRRQLKPAVHGVILSARGRRATFLPQVWDQLPDIDSFLGHLCLKAGLEENGWTRPGLSVQVYTAEYFSE